MNFKWLCLNSTIAVVLLILGSSFGQEIESPKLAINGYVLSDHRVTISNGENEYSWRETRLSLKSEYKLTGSAKMSSEVWIRTLGYPSVTRLSDLQSPSSPVDVLLREASVELYNCGIDKLDLKIGRQRIAWGTADKINPTDNLDAPDMEDIWDFGRRLSSDALKGTYYIGDYTISGVVVPWFQPALLPRGAWLSALMPTNTLPSSAVSIAHINSLTEHIEMPSNDISQTANGGIKIGGRVGDYDLSLSYVYSRDHFPIIYKQVLTAQSQDLSALPMELGVDAFLTYPRMHVAGFDLAGAIGQIGVWAEAGVFFAEKIRQRTIYNGPTPTLEQLSQMPTELIAAFLSLRSQISAPVLASSDDPYVKYVIGADYTFPANLYCNLQYIHGYSHERGDSIEDYLMGTLDWKLLNEKLILSPLGVGLEIKDFSSIRENYAFIAQPQVVWKPIDNGEITLGGRIITGTETTQFGRLKEYDQICGSVKYSF